MKTTTIKAGSVESEPVILGHLCINAVMFPDVPQSDISVGVQVSFDGHIYLPLVVGPHDIEFTPVEPCVFQVDREWFDAAQYIKFYLEKALPVDFEIQYSLREDR